MIKRLCALSVAILLLFTSAYTLSENADDSSVKVLSASEYVMIWKNDAGRGMNYKVPTHWVEIATGERYKVFGEPTPDGVSGFRVCFVNKKTTTDDRSSTRMKKEFNMLISEMESVYEDFAWDGNISRELSIVKFQGYQSEYTYTDGLGTPMQGFVIMAKYDKRIYCMNFSGPTSRYTDMRSVMLNMLDSVTRAS